MFEIRVVYNLPMFLGTTDGKDDPPWRAHAAKHWAHVLHLDKVRQHWAMATIGQEDFAQ